MLNDQRLHVLALYFLGGTLFHLYRERIVLDGRVCLAAAVLLAWGQYSGWANVVSPLALPYVLLWLATRLPLQGFAARGDYTYGIYIYAWPMQQALVQCGLHQWGVLPYFALTMAATLPLAVMSYHFVEKPARSLKHFAIHARRGARQERHARYWRGGAAS